MTNVNNEAGVNVEEVKEAGKPKRIRKSPVKIQKTAVQIGEELAALQTELTELETALAGLAQDNVAYAIVEKAHQDKSVELHNALNQVYTI